MPCHALILRLAFELRKWCRQRRRTGSILPTSGLVEQNNFWLARDSRTIAQKTTRNTSRVSATSCSQPILTVGRYAQVTDRKRIYRLLAWPSIGNARSYILVGPISGRQVKAPCSRTGRQHSSISTFQGPTIPLPSPPGVLSFDRSPNRGLRLHQTVLSSRRHGGKMKKQWLALAGAAVTSGVAATLAVAGATISCYSQTSRRPPSGA